MDLPIQPPLEDGPPSLDTVALDLTWESRHPFSFDGRTFHCIQDAFDAQTNIDGYEIYIVASLVRAQADQNETVAKTLVRPRDRTGMMCVYACTPTFFCVASAALQPFLRFFRLDECDAERGRRPVTHDSA